MQSIANITENLTKQQIQIKSWAAQRTQTYPKVFGFKPYDLAMCALLDSYYPRKINFYLLNLEDLHNPKEIKENNAEEPKIIGNVDNTQEKFEEEIHKNRAEYLKEKKAEKVVLEQAKEDKY